MLAFALSLSIVTTLVSLLIPLLTKQLVDGFSMSSLSGMQIGIIAAVFIVQAALSAYATYALNYSGQKIISGLRDLLWQKLIKLPVSYFDKNATGETISRVTNDTNGGKRADHKQYQRIYYRNHFRYRITDDLIYHELEADIARADRRAAGCGYFSADRPENV